MNLTFFVFSDYNKGALSDIKLMIEFLVKNNKKNILVDPKKKISLVIQIL